jgi:hypothetical protein
MAANADPRAKAGEPVVEEKSAGSLWLWVAAGFLLLAMAWGVLFTVARSAKVESVPLAPTGAKP